MLMSKKNKKKFDLGFDIWGLDTPTPKEGDFRFHQKTYWQETERWWGWDTKKIKETPKMLQRYDGKEWRDIPCEYEHEYL